MSDRVRGVALGVAGSLLVAGLGGALVVNVSAASGQASMLGAVTAGEVTACAKRTTGALRLLKPGRKCKKSEVRLTWSVTGPQGATGPQGPAGPAADVTALQGQVATLQSQAAALAGQVAALEATLSGVSRVESRSDGPTIRFSGVNVQIVDGQDEATDGTTNGLGNLIIGWNESDGDAHSGSHNLVVGPYHSYTSFGGMVVGVDNEISGPNASVSGGAHNKASNSHATVSGGGSNMSTAPFAWVGGGSFNTASGDGASVTGGYGISATGWHASGVGGYENTVGDLDTVLGGEDVTCNTAYQSLVCGEGALSVPDN